VHEPRRRQPLRIDDLEPDLPVDEPRYVHALKIPDAIKRGPIPVQHDVERALIAPRQALGVLTREGERPPADPELPPPSQIDQQHARVEVRRIGRQAQFAVERIARQVAHRADRPAAQIRMPERADVAAHQDIAVEVDDPIEFAGKQLANQEPGISRDREVRSAHQIVERVLPDVDDRKRERYTLQDAALRPWKALRRGWRAVAGRFAPMPG